MYGATFLLLILLAKLSVEHRTLGNVSVDRNGLLAFEQEYFHCVTVGFEIRFDVGCRCVLYGNGERFVWKRKPFRKEMHFLRNSISSDVFGEIDG